MRISLEGKIVFKDATLLITGGTGSFGNSVLERFIDTDIGEIRVFSRDEKKQDDMRKKYKNDRIKFYIGDTRDQSSVDKAMGGVDYIFHAAALKQVPSCEFFPLEAVKTNVLGTENVLSSAIAHGVKKVICLSTDKAAYPINAMGMSKAMMEKIYVAKSRSTSCRNTVICGTRYGNVMASRGSVIPMFVDQIKSKQPLTVTYGGMTRFIMSLKQSVELVLFAFEHGQPGDLFVQKAPACTITTLAQAVKKVLNVDNEIKEIGMRHGEKIYETLLTREEMANAIDMKDFYRVVPDKRDLNYSKYVSTGTPEKHTIEEYTSHNTRRLNIDETAEILLSLDYIQNEIAKREAGK